MSSEIGKDLHFLKHLFAERFFNSNVYSLRRVFNHSKALTTTPTLVYTLRRLFKESTGRKLKQKNVYDGFFLQKLFCERQKKQSDIFEIERLFLDKLFCERCDYSTDEVFNLKAFFRSVNSLDFHCNDSYDIVNNVQDLFHDEESEGIYLYLSLSLYRYFPNLLL